jgi:hypothetical protein
MCSTRVHDVFTGWHTRRPLTRAVEARYREGVSQDREIKARFRWGVLLVTDDESSETIPSWPTDDAQVATSRTAIVVKVLHEVDGVVCVHVGTQRPHPEGIVAFDGTLDVPSGRLRVSDADGESAIVVDVPAGHVPLRIVCDRAHDAAYVDVIL